MKACHGIVVSVICSKLICITFSFHPDVVVVCRDAVQARVWTVESEMGCGMGDVVSRIDIV